MSILKVTTKSELFLHSLCQSAIKNVRNNGFSVSGVVVLETSHGTIVAASSQPVLKNSFGNSFKSNDNESLPVSLQTVPVCSDFCRSKKGLICTNSQNFPENLLESASGAMMSNISELPVFAISVDITILMERKKR